MGFFFILTLLFSSLPRASATPSRLFLLLLLLLLLLIIIIFFFFFFLGDATVTFTSEEELESFITKANEEGGHTREQLLDLYENFVWGLDTKRAALNVSTWSVNHGDGEGMVKYIFLLSSSI